MRTSDYGKNWDKIRIYKILGLLGSILLGGIIFFFLYFKVDHIEVQESSRYSQEEIEDMVLTGIWKSNSILASHFYTRNVEGVPFVEGYVVDRLNRNTILVSLKEKQAVGCIKYLDCYVYFDRTGTIIETSVDMERKIPYFDGLKVSEVVLGDTIKIKDTILNTAVSLVRIFEKNESIPDHIIFDDKYYITLEYGDIQAKLGEDQYLEDKMARLTAILPKLTGKKGILHLEGINDTSTTITFEETQDEEEDTAEEGTESDQTDALEENPQDQDENNADTNLENDYGNDNMYGYGSDDTYGYGSDDTYGYGSDDTYSYGSNNTYSYGSSDTYGYGNNNSYSYGYENSNTYGYSY